MCNNEFKIICEAPLNMSYYSGNTVQSELSKYHLNSEKECYFSPNPCVNCKHAYKIKLK